MKVKFWGTRGSIATPEPEYMKYGGNTACVEVRTADGELIILDAGTGIRRLGASLLAAPPVEKRGSIIISHYHWDHIQGFPFFLPLYVPGWEFSIYGQFKVDGRLEGALSGQMGNLYFPVTMDAFGADLEFVEIIEQEISIGQTLVVSRSLNHPQGNLGFRIMDGEGIFAYVSDTEHYEDHLDERALELARDADVLVYDAQYTPEQYEQRKGWGHSTWQVGAQLARAANVRTLVLFHHDPASTDDVIDRIVDEAVQDFPGTIAASRDLELDVRSDRSIEAQAMPTKISTTVRSRLRYKIKRAGDEVTIRPASFLSLFNSDEFKSAVLGALDDGVRRVRFDFGDVPEIDSLTLGTLAQFLEEAEEREIQFAISGANEFVREVLTITRFDQVIEIGEEDEGDDGDTIIEGPMPQDADSAS